MKIIRARQSSIIGSPAIETSMMHMTWTHVDFVSTL